MPRSNPTKYFQGLRTACRTGLLLAALLAILPGPVSLSAQDIATRNVTVLGVVQRSAESENDHGSRTVYLAIEEDPARSYVYASPSVNGQGIDVYEVRPDSDIDLASSLVFDDLPTTAETRDVKFFKFGATEYVVVAVDQMTPAANSVAAVILDVSDPSPTTVREITTFEGNGFVHLFVYKHSSGKTLLFGAGDGEIHVYDVAELLEGRSGLTATIASPEQPVKTLKGFRDVFAGFDPVSSQDRLYAAGAGGYYVYDVTDSTADSLIASVNPAGILYGHRVMPDPTGSGILTAADYRTAPLRYYDLSPVYNGDTARIRTATGAWSANWCNYAQHFEFRWPYAFVASMEDGFQMVNMRDDKEPYTTAFVRTSSVITDCDPNAGHRGAFDVEVRNRDGLIVVSDLETGLWFLKTEDFRGWGGHSWGVPNVSTVQDWENGPDIIGG